MKKALTLLVALALVLGAGTVGVWAAGARRHHSDRNGDGLCDRHAGCFTDENRNGVCDNRNEDTCRQFTDENRNGICDNSDAGICQGRHATDRSGVCGNQGSGNGHHGHHR